MQDITCFILRGEAATAADLQKSAHVAGVNICTDLTSSAAMRRIGAESQSPYTLIYNRPGRLKWIAHAIERLLQIARDSGAALIYSDRFSVNSAGEIAAAPVADYQCGSLRDDFDFGGVLLLRTDLVQRAAAEMDAHYRYAGLYDLRLRLSRLGAVEHISEYLYYDIETDSRRFGQKLFDYLDPKNRAVQIEMEQACTAHLKAIGAYLPPQFKEVDLESESFEYEASVVIPCRNRVRTIADAINSALGQKTTFKYNVIVVDDNSSDGSAELIARMAAQNPGKLIYIAQDSTYHAIGGNWNAALHHPYCGKFALQLDSDDVYSAEDTVQKFVEAFYAQKCAMVIGSYRITDFDLNPTPAAPITHSEWTIDNGRNNALRINGLGAPRGFWTPLVRQMTFPTTKYGEDYAVALRISRDYRIGRIYDVMYYCRRWEGNSDAQLDAATANRYNTYKDRLRSWELMARIEKNRAAKGDM